MPRLVHQIIRLACEDDNLRPHLVRVLRGALHQGAAAGLDQRVLNQLVNEQAKVMGLQGDGKATSEVVQAAQQFVRKLSQLLSVWVQKYPPLDQHHTVEMMMSKGAALAVYMTLDNRGLGIWSETWDRFYPNTEKLEAFLGRALDREFKALQAAIKKAAIQTTGG